jgi:hypothetical protein
MEISRELLDSFARMVRSDGSRIEILSDDEASIIIGYRPGSDEACASGACVLPHLELQEMMREWLGRRAPQMSVSVRLVRPGEA